MSYPNIIHGAEETVFVSYAATTTTDRLFQVGQRMVLADGRSFRFAENAGTALVIGSLNAGAVPSADTTTEVIDTLAAGVSVLTGIGATTADQAINTFVNGYVYTDNATTLPLHRIKRNTLITAGATTGTITLYSPTVQAIAAANTISYFRNPWRDVVIHPSPNVQLFTGVAKVAAAANEFCWLQTQGPVSVLYDATTTAIAAVGDPVGGDTMVDGAVSGVATGGADITPLVGWAYGVVEGDGEQTLVYLTLE